MEHIFTPKAPRPAGAYSQGVVHGGLVFVSGQVALDPETGAVQGSTIEEQTERVLLNVEAVLTAAGSSFDQLLRVTVFLAKLEEFPRFNRAYEGTLGGARPARTTVGAGALPMGLKIEVDAIGSTS